MSINLDIQNESTQVRSEVLIVEDTQASLALLSNLMQKAGYSVRQAQDGQLALATVQNRQPDIILLDIRMPGLDGFEVCRQLKANPATASIPIIFLSALDDTEARLQGLRLGAVDYIVKPYEADEVLLRVKTQLELHNLQHNLIEMCDTRTQALQTEVNRHQQTMQELLDSRQQLRELSSHLEDIREEERARIAREIHDELGQTLTVARIELTRIMQKLNEPADKLQTYLQNAINLIETSADTARSISENLRPGMLDLLGLEAAIEHHVSQFSKSTGINCILNIADIDADIDERTSIAAFRIVQESLTNVARHSNASQVKIQLADLGKELVVIIQDNGHGFDIDTNDQIHSHYGLLGMHERAKSLGGTLSIESELSKGTRIEAILPF